MSESQLSLPWKVIGVVLSILFTLAAAMKIISRHTPSEPEPDVPVISATELFQLRSACAALGEKLLKELHTTNPTLSTSETSNYNTHTRHCYVMLETGLSPFVATKGHESYLDRDLYDGQTGDPLGSTLYETFADETTKRWGFWYANGSNGPDFTKYAHGQKFDATSWVEADEQVKYDAITAYMDELMKREGE